PGLRIANAGSEMASNIDFGGIQASLRIDIGREGPTEHGLMHGQGLREEPEIGIPGFPSLIGLEGNKEKKAADQSGNDAPGDQTETTAAGNARNGMDKGPETGGEGGQFG